MEEHVQMEEGISLMDIVRLLLSRIKLLILVVLIGGILGGTFAIFKTIDVDYYGTAVEFYVNPEKTAEDATGSESQYGVYGAYGRHVMDNMVKLLGSESFTEKLILNGLPLPLMEGEEGANVSEANVVSAKDLTRKVSVVIDGKTEEKDFKWLIEEAHNEIAKYKDELSSLNNEIATRNTQTSDLNTQQTALNDEWKSLYYDEKVVTSTFNETEYLKNIQDNDDPSFDYLKICYEKTETLEDELEETNNRIATKQTHVASALERVENSTEAALIEWRKTSKYQSQLSLFSAAVSYSYLQSEEDVEDANNLARSFIYVNISVLNDENFAKTLLERVKTVVPDYVEKNMTVPTGYQGTNCQRITRTDDIKLTNPGYTTNQAIRYGLLVAVAALVIACVIIIILDKSDKRLRDPEIITRKFNMPLLGIVPTIEDLVIDQNAKKKADKKKASEVK